MKNYSYDDLLKGFMRWVENYRNDPDGFDGLSIDDENVSSVELADRCTEYLTNLIEG